MEKKLKLSHTKNFKKILAFNSKSPLQTKKIAQKIFKMLKPNAVVFLKGKMGAGKTTFLKGITKNATSGFFVLHEILKKNSKKIHHFDFYRINPMEEINYILDWIGKGYVFIEWPKNLPLKPDAVVHIEITGKTSRIIKCKLL